MFHRILVGVDDSEASSEALAQAIELVEAGHGRLGLLSSAPTPPPLVAPAPIVLPASREELDRQSVEWATRNVEEAAALVPEQIPVTKLVARGSPDAALLEEARSGRWDLIVVGQTQRRHRLPFCEPTGERLNRHSPTPVLIVHEDAPEGPAGNPVGERGRSRRRRRTQVAAA